MTTGDTVRYRLIPITCDHPDCDRPWTGQTGQFGPLYCDLHRTWAEEQAEAFWVLVDEECREEVENAGT